MLVMCFSIKRFVARTSTKREVVHGGEEKSSLSPTRYETIQHDQNKVIKGEEDENMVQMKMDLHRLEEDWKHDQYFLDRSEEKWCETPRAVFNALCYFWSYTWYIAKSMLTRLTRQVEISEDEMVLVARHVRFAVELFDSYLSISAPFLQVHPTRVSTRKDAEEAMKLLKDALKSTTSMTKDGIVVLLQQMVEARDMSLKVVYDEAHGIVGPTLELERFCMVLKNMEDGDMLVYMVAWRSELVVHWHSWQPGRSKSEKESLRWMSKILFLQDAGAAEPRQLSNIISQVKANFQAVMHQIVFNYRSRKQIREIEKRWETEFHKVAEEFEKREMDCIFGTRPKTRHIRDWIRWMHERNEFRA